MNAHFTPCREDLWELSTLPTIQIGKLTPRQTMLLQWVFSFPTKKEQEEQKENELDNANLNKALTKKSAPKSKAAPTYTDLQNDLATQVIFQTIKSAGEMGVSKKAIEVCYHGATGETLSTGKWTSRIKALIGANVVKTVGYTRNRVFKLVSF